MGSILGLGYSTLSQKEVQVLPSPQNKMLFSVTYCSSLTEFKKLFKFFLHLCTCFRYTVFIVSAFLCCCFVKFSCAYRSLTDKKDSWTILLIHSARYWVASVLCLWTLVDNHSGTGSNLVMLMSRCAKRSCTGHVCGKTHCEYHQKFRSYRH